MQRVPGVILMFLLAVPAAAGQEATPAEKAFMKRVGRDCPVIPLWPKGSMPEDSKAKLEETFEVDAEKGVRINAVSNPSMVIIRPEGDRALKGAAVVLCPGGGYGCLATETIVEEAKWLNAMGVTAVLLKYRVPPRKEDRDDRKLPLQDAQRALGILRSRADEWGLDPERIGIGGFSAGGHLAFNAATHFEKRAYEAVDKHDRASCRPDFAILHYPAYLTKPIESLTPNPNLDFDKLAGCDVPPVFMMITHPDKFTFGCVQTLLALRKAKKSVELHVYPTGGHGGCFDKYPVMEFARPLARFLKDHGVLGEKSLKAGAAWLDARVLVIKKKLFPELGTRVAEVPKAEGKVTGMAASELTFCDKEVLKCAGNKALPVFQLWPGKGTREDDPMKSLEEQLGSNRGGLMRLTKIARPTMVLFKPEKPNGQAMVIFPGGGYSILASEHEGVRIAEWLNGEGVTVFLVKYRVPRRKGLEKHEIPHQDAQRAVRLVRSQAALFGIDPNKIGVLGFSAGGHLATVSCLRFDKETYKPLDDHDKVSCRPDFGVLVYPAYLTRDQKSSEVDPLLSDPRRNHTPPLYIAFAADDRFMTGAAYFLMKAREGRVPVECHFYEKGGHGQGMKPSGYPFSEWTKSCSRWLRDVDEGTVVK